jgi:hypothetical protein
MAVVGIIYLGPTTAAILSTDFEALPADAFDPRSQIVALGPGSLRLKTRLPFKNVENNAMRTVDLE